MTIDSIASGGSPLPPRSADSSAALRSAGLRPAGSSTPAAASATDTATAVSGASALPSKDELTKAVSDLNKSAQDNNQGLEFSIDEDSKRTVVKVIDTETKEVLRQMPTKQALEIAKSLEQAQQSFLIKQTA